MGMLYVAGSGCLCEDWLLRGRTGASTSTRELLIREVRKPAQASLSSPYEIAPLPAIDTITPTQVGMAHRLRHICESLPAGAP